MQPVIRPQCSVFSLTSSSSCPFTRHRLFAFTSQLHCMHVDCICNRCGVSISSHILLSPPLPLTVPWRIGLAYVRSVRELCAHLAPLLLLPPPLAAPPNAPLEPAGGLTLALWKQMRPTDAVRCFALRCMRTLIN